MIRTERLIILATTKVGDKSLVLHTFCRELGRRSFIVTAGKGMAMYMPLSILDAEVIENAKSDLWRLRGTAPTTPLGGIRSSIGKTSITMFISEVLFRTLKEGMCDPGLFDWAEKSILTLDALGGDYANYHLRFLLELATALGFTPGAEDIAPFAGDHYSSILELLQRDFASSMLLPLKGSDRNAIASAILKYLSHHTESAINVQSLKVLGELYSR